MDTDLDTLVTAPYVRVDDALKQHPDLAACRPDVGFEPKLSDAELVTLAVMQALLGYSSETRWLRHARKHLKPLFPYVPGQAGYNKRLRKAAGLLQTLIRILATAANAYRRPEPPQLGQTFFPRQVEQSDWKNPPVFPCPSHLGQRPLPLQVEQVAISDYSLLPDELDGRMFCAHAFMA
jgi:hypothetical protein